MTVLSGSAAQTVSLGERLGALLGEGDFIALTGELGSGKTQFARGVAAGIGVDPAVPVTSPTYTLMNLYHGRLPLYHFDLYRLAGDQDVADLGFEEYFYGSGVCLVEWAERLGCLLPEERLTVLFGYLDDNSRNISFEPSGERYEEIIKNM
ncbi:MAG TPA: tRNA (adenosine(37)-N6)-threonylcarbamoyltransferase complex ATPase subunit type 1 TsaE, partial [Geobacteraceae bacterium]|nr:tRNA (adenosine(37)-N6)-threonylcarbamoyltransferase complex ATPase subunit type 1 TsaE [Geobacteraceae bacterium]